MKGPSGSDNIEAVPSLTARPDDVVIGLEVIAVRGVLKACSTVLAVADCVMGLIVPVTGLPE